LISNFKNFHFQLLFAINYTLSYLEFEHNLTVNGTQAKNSGIADLISSYNCGSLDESLFSAGPRTFDGRQGFTIAVEVDRRAREIDSHFLGQQSILAHLGSRGFITKAVTENDSISFPERIYARRRTYVFNELWVRDDELKTNPATDILQLSVNELDSSSSSGSGCTAYFCCSESAAFRIVAVITALQIPSSAQVPL
uniref:Uncharacterized protein n=1 Tax=Gongylonema pulchrum TaxID=637853 RepID=A0A183D6B7_9BILA